MSYEDFEQACNELAEEVYDATGDGDWDDWHEPARQAVARMKKKLADIELVIEDFAADSWRKEHDAKKEAQKA